jgi:hypothetical protein
MNNRDLQAIEKLLFRVGSEVANEAKDIAPYQKGNLKRDIQVFDEHIGKGEVSIGNSLLVEYAPFVHEGTGLYGKHKRKIIPKNKKALKTPFGIFKSTKGQKAQPYLTDGLSNYIKSGALDRAIDACGDEMSEEIFDNLKKSLKNISIK